MQCLRGGGDVRQTVIDQGEIVVNQREVRLDLRRRFVMQARQRKVARVVVEVSEIVVRLDVTRIVFQRLGEVVERANRIAPIQIDDSQIAVRLRDVVAFADSLSVKLGGLDVALLVQHQSFLERRQEARDLSAHGSKQTKLALQLGLDLLNRQA